MNPSSEPSESPTAKAPSSWAFHPIPIGLALLLYPYAHNAYGVEVEELFLPIVILASLTLLLWLALRWLLGNPLKAALLVSLFLLVTMSFGHLIGLLNLLQFPSSVRLRYGLVLMIDAVLLSFLVCAVKRMGRPESLTRLFNIFSLFLITLPVVRIGYSAVQRTAVAERIEQGQALTLSPTSTHLPDIYYIILDGYGRFDVLKSCYDYDNSAFIDGLEHKGFFVADRSTSNYSQTLLSLSSSLNCRYLEDLSGCDSSDRVLLKQLIFESTVIKSLKRQGYRLVTFSTGYQGTDWTGADIYLRPEGHFSEFHSLLINSTPLWSLLGMELDRHPLKQHRERILHTFSRLPELSRIEGPKFVFAHLVSPHPPFVFGENGEDVSPYQKGFSTGDGRRFWGQFGTVRDYLEAYRKQIAFTSKLALQAVERILEESSEPPIIILQSDHGPGSRWDSSSLQGTDLVERMSILNAYYFPDGRWDGLDEAITPVNSFRVVLRNYFNANLERLEETSYYSTWDRPFLFEDVTTRVR